MNDIPHLLRRAHFAFRQATDRMLTDYNLTSAQLDVLQRVAQCECAEHRTLLHDMEVASPTLTKLVNSLVEAGYLERQISPEDARVKVLMLTDAGHTLQADLVDNFQGAMDCMMDGFSPAERMMLSEMLRRVIANIEQVGS
ncbi:MAG: MarR family winged helix-turn-helix transcriptional regulator [Chloroflexota bacterium]